MAALELVEGRVQYAPRVLCTLGVDRVALVTPQTLTEVKIHKANIKDHTVLIPVNANEIYLVTYNRCRRVNLTTGKMMRGNHHPWWRKYTDDPVVRGSEVIAASGWRLMVGSVDADEPHTIHDTRQSFEPFLASYESDTDYKERMRKLLVKHKDASKKLKDVITCAYEGGVESWCLSILRGNCHTVNTVKLRIQIGITNPVSDNESYEYNLTTRKFHHDYIKSVKSLYYSLDHELCDRQFEPFWNSIMGYNWWQCDSDVPSVINYDCVIYFVEGSGIRFVFTRGVMRHHVMGVVMDNEHEPHLLILPVDKRSITAMASLLAEKSGVRLLAVLWYLIADILAF